MRYILCVNAGRDPESVIAGLGLTVVQRYDQMPGMFVIEAEQSQVVGIKADPRVKYVRPDIPTIRKFSRKTTRWNLSAITRHKPIQNADYFTSNADGAGVDVCVMDSGINYNHVDLSGRAFPLPNYIDPWNDNGKDADGHGSHVAGLIAGVVSGVAPAARLYSVRVFGPGEYDAATASEWLTAVNAVISFHVGKGGTRPTVVNMSLGASPSSSDPFVFANDPGIDGDDYLDDSTMNLIEAGITVCVAAGNGFDNDTTGALMGNFNAAYCRPARVGACITVGALNHLWEVDEYSNYGSCVDIYAPGTDVISCDYNNNTNYVLMSGTSMSTPVAVGVCCLFLSKNPTATPAEVKNWLTDSAIRGITNVGEVWAGDPFLNGDAASDGIVLQYTDDMNATSALHYTRNDTVYNRVLHVPYLNFGSNVPPDQVEYVAGTNFVPL